MMAVRAEARRAVRRALQRFVIVRAEARHAVRRTLQRFVIVRAEARHAANERGFALLVVLLVVALVAVIGAEFAYSMRLEAAAVRAYKNGIIGSHLAETALEQAIREIVADAPLLAEEEDGLLTFYTADRRPLPRLRRAKAEFGGGRYSYRITDEEARLNINNSPPDRIDRLLQTLGPVDRVRAEDYLEAVREVERRIEKAEQQVGDSTLPSPAAGIPERFSDHVQLMFDLQWLAYRSDITRVSTFMLGRELNNRTYPEIGVNERHHAVSHHGDNPEQISKLLKINQLQAQLFAAFLEKCHSSQ